MTKIVINRCFGGFGLSDKAMENYFEVAGITYRKEPSEWGGFEVYEVAAVRPGAEDVEWVPFSSYDIARDDPALVSVIEDMGSEEASDSYAMLKVVEIPDDVDWFIDEYDGMEHVSEVHRTWS